MAKQFGSDTAGENFDTFGELLKHLRLRARLTQQALGTAVGYSYAQIARLEAGSRQPEPTAVRARFIDALDLAQEPEFASLLVHLAERARFTNEALSAGAAQLSNHQRLSNIPTRLTPFIGREHDLVDVQQLVMVNRLVTLTGAGGVGKTRLALEAVEKMLNEFPDGVWLVELALVSTPTLVVETIATVFGFRSAYQGSLPPLLEYLRNKRLLLVLDNCEHLVQACAELVDTILRACPDLHILATSRERLNVPSEKLWRVPSLISKDAIALFETRALAAIPESALGDQSSTTIARICERLDGIPLAIELTASRLQVYSLELIASRLDDRFRLLTDGARTALPRHQTLHALISWSYDLLTVDEQCLLRALSVFAGGWTLEGAESVAAGLEVVILLPQLVNKSLVTVIDRAGQRRFSMLETIRQYAADRLGEAGEDLVAHERAAILLAEFAKQLGVDKYGMQTTQWKQLEAELDNIRGLITWAQTQTDPLIGLRFVVMLAEQFTWGYLAEPLAWVEEALQHAKDGPFDLRAAALRLYFRQQFFSGHNMASLTEPAEELIGLSEQLDDSYEKAIGIIWASIVLWRGRHVNRAVTLFEQGLRLHQKLPLGTGQGLSNFNWCLGIVRMQLGQRDVAAAHFIECLRIGREMDNGDAAFEGQSGLAWLDAEEAVRIGATELTHWRTQKSEEVTVHLLQAYTQALILVGDYGQAEQALNECLAIWRRLGVRSNSGLGSAQALLDIGQVAWLQGDPALAQSWFAQSLDEFNLVGDIERIARLHTFIGYTKLAQGETQFVDHDFRFGLNLYQKLEQPAGIALSMAAFAALAEAKSQPERAARLYGVASVPCDRVALSMLWPSITVIFSREIEAARQRCLLCQNGGRLGPKVNTCRKRRQLNMLCQD